MVSEIIFLKDQRNPYLNLALEEVLLKDFKPKSESDGYLFVYINEAAIVCGKNQSIWEEANFPFCRQNNIQIAKRISGGGTVYHDPGNLNYTYITSKRAELVSNFSIFNQPIIDFLQSLGLEAYLNERNDILIDGKKISGNAQNLYKDSLLGHATLLFNAKREFLSKSLKHQFASVESKSIKSKRVEVANISDFLSEDLSMEEFTQGFLNHMMKNFNCELKKPENEVLIKAEKLAREKYEQKEWIYGKSPKTDITIELNNSNRSGLHISLEKGICSEMRPQKPFENLIGKYFDYESIKEALSPELFEQIAQSGI